MPTFLKYYQHSNNPYVTYASQFSPFPLQVLVEIESSLKLWEQNVHYSYVQYTVKLSDSEAAVHEHPIYSSKCSMVPINYP